MSLRPAYPWKVLIFPAASEIGLELCRALRDSKEVILHGAAQPGLSAASFHFKHLHALPSIYEPEALPALQALIEAEGFDAIIPAHDNVVVWLAQHADQLPATVITSPLATCHLCRSKRATYERLAASLPVPRLFSPDDPALPFPLFVKPDCGQGSVRARAIADPETLTQALQTEPDLLLMELLPGREYTIDCFSQRGRGVLFAAARQRVQTRSGISTQSVAAPHVPALEWAQRIAAQIELHGTWFFQLKEDKEGQLKLLEVAPRVAGSMAFSRVQGPNFPLLSLYEAAGVPLKIESNALALRMGRSLDVCFRFDEPFDALYIDLDDVLLLRGEVNTRLIALLFQCRNRKIPVCLLTKHRGDLNATLAQHHLSDLFDRIEHLPPDPMLSKAQAIHEANAVLIDDSFSERALVHRDRPDVRCFDAAGALCLIDERA